jgi:hypothetical protein
MKVPLAKSATAFLPPLEARNETEDGLTADFSVNFINSLLVITSDNRTLAAERSLLLERERERVKPKLREVKE